MGPLGGGLIVRPKYEEDGMFEILPLIQAWYHGKGEDLPLPSASSRPKQVTRPDRRIVTELYVE